MFEPQTILLDFVPNPTLSVANVSICPLQTGTLSVSGASTYVWNTAATGSLLTGSPAASTQYSVVGTALGCTASANANIILKPLPIPTLSSNSPVCNSQSLTVTGSGGVEYVWTGPLSFTSNVPSSVIYRMPRLHTSGMSVEEASR